LKVEIVMVAAMAAAAVVDQCAEVVEEAMAVAVVDMEEDAILVYQSIIVQ
jgi:hypothetical protein